MRLLGDKNLPTRPTTAAVETEFNQMFDSFQVFFVEVLVLLFDDSVAAGSIRSLGSGGGR